MARAVQHNHSKTVVAILVRRTTGASPSAAGFNQRRAHLRPIPNNNSGGETQKRNAQVNDSIMARAVQQEYSEKLKTM
jgi:hypothetical protein